MFRTKEIYENLFIEMHWYFYEQSANSHFTLFHRTEKSALAKVKQYSIAVLFFRLETEYILEKQQLVTQV